jgi:hypothetical protein
MFGLGDDSASAAREAVSDIRSSLLWLAHQFEGRRFYYRDRQRIAETVEDIIRCGGEHVTEEAREADPIEFVPARKDPSAEQLEHSLRSLRSTYQHEHLEASVTDADVDELMGLLGALRAELEDADPFPFKFKEEEITHKHGKALISHGDRTDMDPEEDNLDPSEIEDTFAGPDVRWKLDLHADKPDTAMFVGTGTRKGKDASIEKSDLARHTATFGVTGYGKTTFLSNNFRQLMWKDDAGGCFIDPKGDDALPLIEILPEHRLDDVIFIEPSGREDPETGESYLSGFNFIDVGLSTEDPNYQTAVSALIEDLIQMLGAETYWGPRMDRVTRNLLRAMHRYNDKYPDRADLTLTDLYYILKEEAARKEFAAMIADAGMPFVQEYTQKVADIPDQDLDPILGRLQKWVEDPIARKVISFRRAEWSIPEAVREGKIIILKMGVETRKLKRMLGMSIIRRIWAAIKGRAERDDLKRSPFYLFTDEFDNIAQEGNTESLSTMFSEARSYGLSLNIANQYPDQLPDDVMDEILVNCDHTIAFNTGSHKQAKHVAPKLGEEVDTETLLDEARFHCWMRATPKDGENPPAYRVYANPLYPPLRTRDEANALVAKSVRKYGRPTPSAYEEQRELLFFDGDGRLETGVGEMLVDLERRASGGGEEAEMWMEELIKYQEAIEAGVIPMGWDAVSLAEARDGEHPRDDPDADLSDALPDDKRPEDVLKLDAGDAPIDTGSIPPKVRDAGGVEDTDTAAGEDMAEAASESQSGPGGTSGAAGAGNVRTAEELLEHHERDILEGIYAAAIRRDAERGVYPLPGASSDDRDVERAEWVTAEESLPEIERRVGATGYQSYLGNAIEILAAGEYLDAGVRDNEPHVRLTKAGRQRVLRQDTGSNAAAGGLKHRFVLSQAFEIFTALGFNVTIPNQEDGENVDGFGDAPLDLMDINDPSEFDRKRDRLKEEYPEVWELSEGAGITLEAETSTPDKPHQPVRNLRKAVNDNRRCVFLTTDGTGDTTDHENPLAYWAQRLDVGLYGREQEGRTTLPKYEPEPEIDVPAVADDVEERFILSKEIEAVSDGVYRRRVYNLRRPLSVENGTRRNPDAEDADMDVPRRVVWPLPDDHEQGDKTPSVEWAEEFREGGDSRVVAEAGNHGVVATFPDWDALNDPDAIREHAPAYYTRTPDDEWALWVDGEKRVYETEEQILANWAVLRAPYLPEHRLDRAVRPDDYRTVILPDATNPDHDQPLLYDRGEVTPLYDALGIDPRERAAPNERAGEVQATEVEEPAASEPDQEPGDSQQDPGQQPSQPGTGSRDRPGPGESGYPPSAAEAQRDQPAGQPQDGHDDTTARKAGVRSDAGADITDADGLLEHHQGDILEGIYAAIVRRNAEAGILPMPGRSVADREESPHEWAPIGDVTEQIERRVGSTGYQTHLSSAIERLPSHLVQQERRNGKLHLRLTDQGESEVLKQDSGESGTSGGEDHRFVLGQAFEVFTALGYVVTIPDQQGDLDVDGLADPPMNLLDANSMRELRRLEERLRETFPEVAQFSDGSGLTFEAETSTPRKPQQPITNLRKAVNNDQVCVFVTKDGTDDHRVDADATTYWCRRLETALYDRERDGQGWAPVHEPGLDSLGISIPSVDDGTDERLILARELEIDDDGAVKRRLYNRRNHFSVEERTREMNPRALRPMPEDHRTGDRTPPVTWTEEHTPDGDSEIVLSDEENGEIARFSNPEALNDPKMVRAEMPAWYERDYEADEIVVHVGGEEQRYMSEDEMEADWGTVRQPYVPINRFERPVEPDDFRFLTMPDVTNDEWDQPILYRKGETVGLYDYLGLTDGEVPADYEETDTTPATADTATDPSTAKQDQPARASSEEARGTTQGATAEAEAVAGDIEPTAETRDPETATSESSGGGGAVDPVEKFRQRASAPDGDESETTWPDHPPVTADTLAGLPGDTDLAVVQQRLLDDITEEGDSPDSETRLFSIAIPSGIRQGSLLATALAATHASKSGQVDQPEDAIAATDFPINLAEDDDRWVGQFDQMGVAGYLQQPEGDDAETEAATQASDSAEGNEEEDTPTDEGAKEPSPMARFSQRANSTDDDSDETTADD